MLHPTPRRFHVVALAVGIATAVACTWPVAAHVSDHVIDAARMVAPDDPGNWWAANIGADVLTTAWIVNWVLHGLVTQPMHLFDANIFYPAPLSLARSEHMFATALLGAPGAVVAGPVAAHQTALLLCLVLALWTTAYVVARWEGSITAGLAAGALLVTCPVLMHSVAHLQFLGVAYFPLMVFALDRFRATGRGWWAAAGAAALVAQMLSGQYLAYAALVVWAVAGGVAVVAPASGAPRAVRVAQNAAWLALTSALAAVVVLPFVVPYLRLLAPQELPDNTTSPMFRLGIYSVGEYLHAWQPGLAWIQIPLVVQLLAAIGLGALAADGRYARAATLLGVAAVGGLLSIGPKNGGLGLYRLCLAIVPGFHTAREPVRWALLPHFAAALLAGSGAALLVRRLGRAGIALTAVAVALACAMSRRSPLPLRALPVGNVVPDAYRFLARCGEGDPLLELPVFTLLANFQDADRDYFSTIHWLPILNGRSGYPPPLFSTTMELAKRLPDDMALAALRHSTGVRWVLVHCAAADAGGIRPELCRRGGWSGPRLRVFEDLWLYDLGPVAQLPRRWPKRRLPEGRCS